MSAPDPRPHPFVIDVPRPKDAADLAGVHVRTWREAYEGLVPPRHWSEEALERRTTMWEHILGTWPEPQLRERVRVAREASGREVVGFATIGMSRGGDGPRTEELQSLYVISDVYGTGVAQALVAELLGERPAYLWVADPNARAQRFYTKIGFRADGTTKVDETLGDLREIRMVR